MVPLGLPSVRPMAQALRLPFEYYYYLGSSKLCLLYQFHLLFLAASIHFLNLVLDMAPCKYSVLLLFPQLIHNLVTVIV